MIREIENNFYRITLRMPYRLRQVNAYLFAHNKELALFDTGLNMPGAYETLEKDITGAGFSINSIRHIFLTHVHTDHCSMAGILQKKTGAEIYSHTQSLNLKVMSRSDSAWRNDSPGDRGLWPNHPGLAGLCRGWKLRPLIPPRRSVFYQNLSENFPYFNKSIFFCTVKSSAVSR